MNPVRAATWTILVQFQALCIVLPVFCCSIGPLLALGAGKVNYASSFRFLGHILLYYLGKGTGPYRSPSLTYCETQSLFESYGVNQLDFHRDIIARHDHLYPFR